VSSCEEVIYSGARVAKHVIVAKFVSRIICEIYCSEVLNTFIFY